MEQGDMEGCSYSNEKISRHINLKERKGRGSTHFFALMNCFSNESIGEEAGSG